MEGCAQHSRLQPARRDVGLNRQYAEFRGGDQNDQRKATGRHHSEDKGFYDFRFHYSITVMIPDMSSWPSPQKTSHRKVNLPTLSGTNRTFSTTPGVMSARSSNAESLKPWCRSWLVNSNSTGTPLFTVNSLGLN